jgi:outer membrane protein assembly factor BamB
MILRTKISTSRLVLGLLLTAFGATAQAEDWPTYQHDNRRSARSSEDLSAAELGQAWIYRPPQPPRPAWDGPAKWDAYANLSGLKSMRNYDPVFHVTVAGQSLFYGSSADNSVHCLDTRTGNESWVFTTDSPVRIAPTLSGGRIFFGSDDGYAYCLDAKTAELVWKFSPSERSRLLLQDGQFVSFWPCRTGVMIDGGTAYFGTGMLPWKESYLCALDCVSGKPDGADRFVRKLEGVTMEGALLASSQRLISPQGRVPPLLFNRKSGAPQGSLPAGGGCFVLLTEDSRLLYGPGNKGGWIQESDETDRAKIATFNGGQAIVVEGNTAYLLTDKALIALNRTTRAELWQQPWEGPCALIQAGPALYVGGVDRVAAFRASDGQPLWRASITGRAYGLAAANGALFASTDDGFIYCFRRGSAPVASLALKQPEPPPSREGQSPLELAAGPFLKFVGRNRAVVWWRTSEATTTHLEWSGQDEKLRAVADAMLKTEHTATLEGLNENRIYSYTIKGLLKGQPAWTERFECDTAFNYNPRPLPETPSPFPQDAAHSLAGQTADEILATSGLDRGVCLVLGCGDGQLVYELAKRSQLQVIGVDTSEEQVQQARKTLLKAGVYGTRMVIYHVPSLAKLPFPSLFANLIVGDAWARANPPALSATNVVDHLRPYGSVALIGRGSKAPRPLPRSDLASWLAGVPAKPGVSAQLGDGWVQIRRGPLPGAGVWSHEYGTAANAAYGGETLQAASSVDDLEVQWLGRPGPRVQADRNGRKPSPLATNGRLFMQGLQRIIALDAFNGSILWTREIPPLLRFNIPRDCSNWCADDDSVYAAINDQCWRLSASSGEILKFYPVVPGIRNGWEYEWSYLAIEGSKLVGSAAKKGSSYTNFWGGSESGWYDAKYGPATDKVCSENLFALDRDSGALVWMYQAPGIINSTITIGANRLFFLESRHPQVKAFNSGRIGLPELWEDLHLVALDRDSGRKIWDEPVKPAPGQVVIYLAYGEGKLALVSSGDKNYHVYAFDQANGQSLWQSSFPWPNDNHGRHMSRPAIVNQTLYVRPKAFDLATGAVRPETVPDGGCGTYAASSKALFFRNGNVTVWDVQTAKATSWERLRPDCWLSTVPAEGLLLSPEAGGGCSCGSWMETSIAFAPRRIDNRR